MNENAGGRGRRGYHHGNLRPALIEAGLRLLEREGLKGLSLRAVAREAGVSRAAPYHHFADRDALLAAIAAKAYEGLETSVAEFERLSGKPEEKFRTMAAGYVGFAVSQPEVYRLLFGTAIADKTLFPELREAGAASYRAFARAIAALRAERGSADAEDPMAALAAWTMLHGLAMAAIEGRLGAPGGGNARSEEFAVAIADVLLRGL